MNVARTACKFGTATARITVPAGTAVSWAITGGSILTGDKNDTASLGFGGAEKADLSVTISGRGCTATGTVTITLRDPFDVDRLDVFPPVPSQDEPAVITWSYRGTTDPARTQRLTVGGVDVHVDASARSYAFTPAVPGPLAIQLDASTIAVITRRRAVGIGDPVPPTSLCANATRAITASIAPRCTHPTATVSGGGNGCGSAIVRASFRGTPPFRGKWSDGLPFTTSADELTRTVTADGEYALGSFEDATCAGTVAGSVSVRIFGTPSAALTASWSSGSGRPPAIPIDHGPGFPRTSLGYQFTNATGCAFTSALGNAIQPSSTCSGAGGNSILFPSIGQTAGEETVTFQVTGPCGQASAPLSFFMCDYGARLTPLGPTTFCEGGSVQLRVEVGTGTNAGPPYFFHNVYRCAKPAAECRTVNDFTRVFAGVGAADDTYRATQAGIYVGTMTDKQDCPSKFGVGAITVTVQACP